MEIIYSLFQLSLHKLIDLLIAGLVRTSRREKGVQSRKNVIVNVTATKPGNDSVVITSKVIENAVFQNCNVVFLGQNDDRHN